MLRRRERLSDESAAVGCNRRGFCLTLEVKMEAAVLGECALERRLYAGWFVVGVCSVGVLLPDMIENEKND